MLERRPLPIVMLTAFSEADLVSRAVDAGVFGYLVKPFRESDLLPAIESARARHAELVELREESGSLRDALEARKLIERAKGLLMEKDGIGEDAAFARMRARQPADRQAAARDRRGRAGGVRSGYLTSVRGGRPIRLISRWASASSSRPDTLVRRSSYQTAPCSDTKAITGFASSNRRSIIGRTSASSR